MSSPHSDWRLGAAPSVPVLLPLPTSSCSRLDNLTLRSVYAIMTAPPPVWRGKLVYLADMYDEKYNVRVEKLEEERKKGEARWSTNPLTPPQGVSAKEWNKRCLEADERERRDYEEGSDSTVTAETENRPKQVKVKKAKAKAKDNKPKVSNAANKSMEEITAKAKKRLSL
ncbi:hypothetical protein BR93DRAFT_926546 [Coniochaeta sp. PMI_546]|nr:hypothetical protein BR93DRAFT_926546 [Coniochaeta sp. PMI_546]